MHEGPIMSFDISRFLLSPGSKVYGFLIDSDIKLDVLKNIVDLMVRYGVEVPSAQYYVSPEGGSIRGLVFVDLTKAKVSIEDLAQELGRIDGVKSVKVLHPSVEGFVTDTVSMRLLVAGERAFIVRKPIYESLVTGIRRQFGSAGEAFLYYYGRDAGIRLGESYQRIAESLGVRDPVEILQKIMRLIAISMGFGRPEIVKVSLRPLKVFIRLYGNPECELGIGVGRPYSHWMRGIAAGILTQLFNVKMKAEETLCIAKGDPYCEFKIVPEEA